MFKIDARRIEELELSGTRAERVAFLREVLTGLETLPELAGTEKEIAGARKLRQREVAACRDEFEKFFKYQAYPFPAPWLHWLAFILLQTSAGELIHRH